jgi:flagellar basal-body rod protein FlgG
MTQSLNTAATGMAAQQTNLDVISNNLANVNTTGYKAERAEFQDLMYQTANTAGVSSAGTSAKPSATQVGLGSTFSATESNFSVGALTSTGNPLDVAINGSGFFKVLLPDGQFAYTRDGSFQTDATGLLVTSDGYPVQPAITIPQGSTSISVSNQGVISLVEPGSSDTQTLSPPINVTNFPNPGALQRMGQNLFLENAASGSPQDGNPGANGTGGLASGYLEASNVQVVQEMVNMITAQRAYEINSKAIQTSDEMLNTANGLKR